VALKEIAQDVFRLKVSIANVYFVGPPEGPWALVDTGTPKHANQIREAAESIYGSAARPAAILLTHGHMDHAGSALDLANMWDVPVFAHVSSPRHCRISASAYGHLNRAEKLPDWLVGNGITLPGTRPAMSRSTGARMVRYWPAMRSAP
jgi:glyoxylase-like metal-dependent hydrolase (beta-lactamase superfamily II)